MKTIFMSVELYAASIIKNMKMALPNIGKTFKKEFMTAICFYEIIERQLSKGVIVDITRIHRLSLTTK